MTTPVPESEIYARIGDDGFRRLVAAFYRRVVTDDLLGPMYPKDDMAGSEERLRLFLIQRFGGPYTYSESRGHPRLRMRHAPFKVDHAARDRWIEMMGASLAEAQIPADVAATLRPFFHSTATFMINHGAPPPGRLGLTS
ncbi:MAG: globin [Phycisphaerae bacterium]|nr:hypothetical protein [Tepidisphaeraceae bacterium]